MRTGGVCDAHHTVLPTQGRYNLFVMIDKYLVPQLTVVTAKGDGEVVDISAAQNRAFLLTLNITNVIEQESLDVAVLGSSDAATWEPKPLTTFQQKFYRGETPILLDLSGAPEVKFLRAHWEVNRWGRGAETPMFEFSVQVREVPADLLRDAQREARSRT